jgi:uncharacterized protein YigE (DUF2233 family)
MTRLLAIAVLLGWTACQAGAETCRNEIYEGNKYSVCEVDLNRDKLGLFLYAADGSPYGYFSTLDKALKEQGKRLGFAMNAGMYHDNRAPVGYYLENGEQVQRVISSAGPGNFGLVPNGVLCLRAGRADVFETKRFIRQAPKCTSATQSGPMLVIDGKLHPKFLKDGTSRYVRNGVGTSADGKKAYFAISNGVVNFFDFGVFFRDRLKLPNALYFDGNISRMRAPELGRNDIGFSPLGPIIGVITGQ